MRFISPQRSLSHSFAMVLDAPFVSELAVVGERGRCLLTTLAGQLREGGLFGYPERSSGAPQCPVGTGTAVMEALDGSRSRRPRGGIAAGENRGGGGEAGVLVSTVITGIIDAFTTAEHRHNVQGC